MAQTPAQTRDARYAERITDDLRQYADVVVAHDHVHPQRDACGGIGGCALMRAEHDAREEVREAIDTAARRGLALTVTAAKR